MSTGSQYLLGKASAKNAGRFQQIPFINAWGEKESNGGLATRIFNLNPSYTSKVALDDTEKELQRLYTKTGESVLPTRADKSFTLSGETYNLTAEEYVKFATTQGETKKRK